VFLFWSSQRMVSIASEFSTNESEFLTKGDEFSTNDEIQNARDNFDQMNEGNKFRFLCEYLGGFPVPVVDYSISSGAHMRPVINHYNVQAVVRGWANLAQDDQFIWNFIAEQINMGSPQNPNYRLRGHQLYWIVAGNPMEILPHISDDGTITKPTFGGNMK